MPLTRVVDQLDRTGGQARCTWSTPPDGRDLAHGDDPTAADRQTTGRLQPAVESTRDDDCGAGLLITMSASSWTEDRRCPPSDRQPRIRFAAIVDANVRPRA